MRMDEKLAIAFIQRHGDPVEQARLRFLLAGERPPNQVLDTSLDGQRPDGAFTPFWAPGASSLDATCYRIAQAEQLGLDGSEPRIARVAAFIAGRQQVEGSWEEDESLKSSAPPWAAPGNPSARLYLTANCGFWLAALGRPDSPTWIPAARKAASYLKEQQDERGALPGFLHASWLAAGLWARLEHMEPAGRACRYLESRLPDLTPSNLAWMLVTLGIAGMPGSQSLIKEALTRLEGSQEPDGRWQSEDGPERDVHTTLEALRAVRYIKARLRSAQASTAGRPG